jgi:hypothetical protein
MKKLQQFFAVFVLTLAIALSASGGDILGPGTTSPPPPPPPQNVVMGDTETPDPSATGDTSTPDMVELDPLLEAALSMLQSILALF